MAQWSVLENMFTVLDDDLTSSFHYDMKEMMKMGLLATIFLQVRPPIIRRAPELCTSYYIFT